MQEKHIAHLPLPTMLIKTENNGIYTSAVFVRLYSPGMVYIPLLGYIEQWYIYHFKDFVIEFWYGL